MLLNAGPFRPPSARACAVLLLPLLALPLGCSSDEGSSSDTIEAPSTTAAPVDEVGDEDADADADALACTPANLSAAATSYQGWALSHEVCASGNAVATLTSLGGEETLVGFFGVGERSWALIVAGPPEDYSADSLPQGVSRVMFSRWRNLMAPPPAPATTTTAVQSTTPEELRE